MKSNNLMVGSTVVVDYGRKWRGLRADLPAEIKRQIMREAEAGSRYGHHGTVMAYDATERQAEVVFEDGELERFYQGDLSVLALPEPEGRVTAYDVVSGFSPGELVMSMRSALEQGWQPIGGPFLISHETVRGTETWGQAVVRSGRQGLVKKCKKTLDPAAPIAETGAQKETAPQ